MPPWPASLDCRGQAACLWEDGILPVLGWQLSTNQGTITSGAPCVCSAQPKDGKLDKKAQVPFHLHMFVWKQSKQNKSFWKNWESNRIASREPLPKYAFRWGKSRTTTGDAPAYSPKKSSKICWMPFPGIDPLLHYSAIRNFQTLPRGFKEKSAVLTWNPSLYRKNPSNLGCFEKESKWNKWTSKPRKMWESFLE